MASGLRCTISNAGDGAYRQIAALDDAVNDLKDGHFCMGEYHFSLMVMDQDREAVRKHRTHAIKVLSDCELLAVPVRVATDATFFAQLPGNWRYRPQIRNCSNSRHTVSYSTSLSKRCY
ncbi:hypothetical protein GBN32_05675 [Plesiomonas shigelloides]|uniref:VirB4 family type IV secretion/conjugal transfer ATPase n=1 Tax=Plesiomonas shigelloides TaxID=703 RepID=UPI00126255F8|nr:hypothetical protein GBN32_05675 [Plesiomonas shigelloides]